MNKENVQAVLGRVLMWPEEDQAKLVRFVDGMERHRTGDEITDEEWNVIEQRAARRDLASDEEVSQVFSRYRRA